MDLKRLSKRTLAIAMLVLMLSLNMSAKTSAAETSVSDWDALKTNVETGNSVIFEGNITASDVDAIYSKNTVPETINLNSKVLDAQVNQGYESSGIPHNSVFYFEGNAEGAKTSIMNGTIQNAINSTLYWQVWGSELEIADMNFINNYVTGQYTSRYGQGGAVKLASANKVTISDSVFTGNTVHDASNQSYGGAIESYVDNLIITNSTLNYNGIKDYNSIPQTTTQDGGAIMLSSENSTLDTVTFASNKSTNSGGAIAYIPVYNINSSIKNSTFEGNETVNKGGAIFAEKSEITDSANIGLTVENTDFTSNKATGANSKGGAIYASSDVNSLIISDSSFKNNVAKEGGAIYSESSFTTTIKANTKDVIFENNNSTGAEDGTGSGIYLTGALNAMASEGKTLTINDTIKFAGSNSMLNINTDFTNNYAGTVVLDKALDGGYGINLGGGATGDAGTLKLGQEAANQTLNFLGAYGAALDLRNDHAGDVLTINELSANRVSTTNLNLDFDASSGVSDKLVINSLESGVDSAKFNLNAINVTADGTASSGTFMESAVKDNIELSQSSALKTLTSEGYEYTFTLDNANFGVFNVTRTDGPTAASLAEAIANSTIDAYSMQGQETVTQTLGTLAGNNRSFTIFGNGNDIITSGSSIRGIIVNSDQTLTIDNVGNSSVDTSKGFSGFSTAAGSGGALYIYGTTTINDSIWSDNSAKSGGAVYNTNNLYINADKNVALFKANSAGLNGGALNNFGNATINANSNKVIFDTNSATNSGGAIANNSVAAINADGANVEFTGNTAKYGGAIYNTGTGTNTATLNASGGDILFEGNSASYGGAIYNYKGSLIVNAIKEDVIFKNNTATVYGGAIYNAATTTLNALGGNILFENNTASQGGAISNATNAVLTLNADGGDITFKNNSVSYGGAIYNCGTLNLMAKGGNNITFSSDSTSKGIVVVHKDAIMNIGSQENPEYYNGDVNFGDVIWDAWIESGEKVGGTINVYSGKSTFDEGFYVKNFNNYGGNVYIKNDITATDGTIINNGNITFTSGEVENYGISVSADIIGNGTLTFDDGASFGNDVDKNWKKIDQKSIYITENGSLGIKARDLTVDEDIVNDGTFNIGAGVLTKAISGKGTTNIHPYYDHQSVDASENTVSIYNNIDQNITVVLGAILEVNDGVEKLGAINNSDTVDFRTDFDIVNSIIGDGSTIDVNNGAKITVKNEIDALNMNVNDGTVVLNTTTDYFKPSDGTTNHLRLTLGDKGVLDMRDTNKTINEIRLEYFKSDNGTLHFDTDFADDKTDTIKASNGYNSEFKKLNLGSINVKSHFGGDVGTTKNIDIFTGSTSPYDYGDMTVAGVAASTLDNYTYVFTPTDDIDVIKVTKHDFISLSDAIGDTASLGLTTYTFDQDLTTDKSLGALAGANRNFGIYGNGHTVQGNDNQGVTVSNGQTLNLDSLTFDGFNNAVTNQGTLNLNASTNDVVFSANQNAINNTGTVNMAATKGNNIIFEVTEEGTNNNIYNTGTLNLNKGNIQILSAITDDTVATGTTNIGTATTTATVTANEITQNELNIANRSSLAINADGLKITQAVNNLGTITLGDGTLTSAIGGTDGTTVIDGNVNLANNLTNQNVEIANGSLIANSTTDYLGATNNLTIKNNGILDLSSEDKSINTVAVNNFTVDSSASNDSGIKFDVNFDDTNLSDKISIAGKATGNLNVQAINAKGDFDGDIDSTKTITLVEGSDISGLSIVADSIRTATSQYSYDFTASNEAGKLIVTKADGMTLPAAIGQEGYNHNVTAYTLLDDYTSEASLGTLAGDNREFTIYGNKNDIIASGSVAGVRINEGQTLTIDKVGDIADSNSKGFSGLNVDHYSTIDNSEGGTLNISDSIFSDNRHYLYSAAVYNIGEANITNSIFRDNGVAIRNNVATSYDGSYDESSVKYLGVANITDTDFINNESDYGAIINSGTMSIVAQDKDVLFSGNNSTTTTGGAIYNTDGNLPFAGLGVLNLNAKNGNKITFAAATDTANNDIYNLATLNLNEGNIEILSAITDAAAPTGTTNIGTKDTTATVVANAITQKALNINNGSSLAINADGLKITQVVNNLGTITLSDGILNSAIDGTDGTTVIDGDVTLASNLTNQNIEITNGSLIANSTTDYIGSTNNLTIKNNGILDLSSSDKTINTVEVNNFTVDGSATANSGIKFDVNFDGANVSNDKVSVVGNATGNLNVKSVNVKGDLDGDIDTTTKTFNLVEGSNISGLTLISDSIRTVTGQYAYDFTAGTNDGELLVTKTNGMTLQEAIGQNGVDYNVTNYSLSKDYTADSSLGTLLGNNRDFTINGNDHDLIANGENINGITVNKGQTLTIQNVGDVTVSNSKGFSGFKAYYGGAIHNKEATVNIATSTFSGNTAEDEGGVIYNDYGSTLTVTDSNFSGNSAKKRAGAIVNYYTANIIAENKDILFEDNNAELGGAIANWYILNLNAKDDHKITFAAATGTVNNDIYNTDTLNLNEGNIEILSAITDFTTPYGTTNIGTADTTAAVVANAITQKALNINNGSSLTINDAGNLKITDTISNLGTITLNGGTLASAIGGENGTTVINGDVTASSSITQTITVNADKSLTASANNIGGAVTNSGTVNLNSGTLAQTITGGNINILASQEVTSDLSKLDGNFTNQGTLNLQGELSSDIKGSGTTVLQNDIALAEDRTIEGTLNANNKNINMQDTPTSYTTLTVNNLAGKANLQIDSNLSGGQTDKISTLADSLSGAILNLTSVNVTSDAQNLGLTQNIITYLEGNTNNIQFQLNGANDGTLTTYTGNYEYVFNLGDKGKLNVTKTASTVGLSKFINGTDGITGNTFSLTEDTFVTQDGAIGTTNRDAGATTLTLNINEHTLSGKGTKDFDGITVAEDYTLNVNGETANQGKITNFDTALTNNGTLNVSNIKFENNNKDIVNSGTLNLDGTNTFAKGIEGNGSTNIISGTTTNNGTITQDTVSIASSATLNTNASNLITSAGVVNAGILQFIGGENANAITGGGTTQILGDVINNALISQAIDITSGSSLKTSADNIGGAVSNAAELEITGGTLAHNVTGAGDVIVSGKLTNNATLEADTITLNSNILGTGGLNLSGTNDISGGTNTISQNTITNNGTLTANVGQINATSGMTNDSSLSLKGGVDSALENKLAISGSGTTTFNDKVNNSANIEQTTVANTGELTNTGNITAAVNNSGTLNSSADNIIGTVDNTGTYNIQGGTIASAISGDGTINISDAVTSNVKNTATGEVNILEGATLALGSGQTELFAKASSVNAQNGSTINLLNGSSESVNIDNLIIASGDNVNLQIDWKDIIDSSSTKINGILNLSKVDLTSTIGEDENYQLTENLKDKLSLGQNLELAASETSNNHIAYDPVAGVLFSSKETLESVISKNDNTNSVYQMVKDEEISSELGTISGTGSTLVNDNAGMTIETGNTLSLNNIKDINGFSEDLFAVNDGTINLDNVTISNKVEGDGVVNVVGDATINNSITNTINLNSGDLTLGQTGDLSQAASFVTNGGSLNLQNGVIQNTNLGNLILNSDLDLKLEGNFANQTLDTITANSFTSNGKNINISNILITEPTTVKSFSISPIGEGMNDDLKASLAGAIQYTGGDITYSPIYKYTAAYDPTTAMFNFGLIGGGGGYDNFNPSVLAAPVAAQLGGYLNQLNAYDNAFRNMDMYMLMTKEQRQAMKYRNKYASAANENIVFDPTVNQYENKAGWFRPYGTFENVSLNNGPKVSNVAYGTYFGAESELYELGNGWDGMWGLYGGYNGSHQAYNGVGIYQNGGTFGAVGMAYKDNFFTGLTANIGASVGDASTMFGSEDFAMLMTGIASKTGYNYELADGRFIIQPSLLMSYTLVNTFDYRNAAGVKIDSDPLHAIQLEPGIKFIGNLQNGWQPYAGVSVVWNIMDRTQFKANDVSLPNLSVDPFVKYGVGVRKSWGEKFTGFFQTYITNGGRNGVGLQAGLRWTLGKTQPSGTNKVSSNLPEKTETKITLNNLK